MHNQDAEPISLDSWAQRYQDQPGHQEAVLSAAFLRANGWQRQSMQLRAQGYDGLLVLVGLFLVLILENVWSFDRDSFESSLASDVFLALLLLAASSGLFTVFTITLINMKLQRLQARDEANFNSHVVKPQSPSWHRPRYDRLAENWAKGCQGNQWQAASLAYEWYHGSWVDQETSILGCLPYRPRSHVQMAFNSFMVMVLGSVVALAVKLGDSQGIGWGISSALVLSPGILLPALHFKRSLRTPPGTTADDYNPFGGI